MRDHGVMGTDERLGHLPRDGDVGVKGVRCVWEREARVNEGGQLVLVINEEHLR